MKFTVKYFPVACIMVILGSCTTDPEPLRSDVEYFPVKKGLYRIYQVEETEYTILDTGIARSYQLMTEVKDSTLTPEGYKYIIHRHIRNNNTLPWNYLDSWSAIVSKLRLVVDEESVPYVKLAFPARNEKTWDGNAYNTLGEDEYQMDNVGESAVIDSTEYADCIVVNQSDFDDPIVSRDIRKEVYARDIGLVLREVSQLNYCTDDNCLGQKKIEDGIVQIQTLIEYGVK